MLFDGRIRTLDGIRGISITLVLAAHGIGTGIIPMNDRAAHLFADIGVRSFFILSGFLITTLLMRERDRSGGISLGRFYARRSLRIFPAFYAYLAVTASLAAIGLVAVKHGDLFVAGAYVMNFQAERSWSVGHLWSLAVEEQFYLVWPAIIVVLGLARAWSCALGAVLVAPVARLVVWFVVPEYRALVDSAFPCVIDTLAAGCLLALARERLTASARIQRIIDRRWFWFLPAICIGVLAITRPELQLGAAMTMANFGIAAVIFRCVSRPDTAVGRILEHPLLAWVGTLSYSLYLWQQLFLNRRSDAWPAQFPVNIIGAFLAAIACHYLIERPVLQLSAAWRERGARKPVIVNVPDVPEWVPAIVRTPSVTVETPTLISSDEILEAPRPPRPTTATLRPHGEIHRRSMNRTEAD
jgi:peptidoglycan/LPS O-acetylase OafA/YrhL